MFSARLLRDKEGVHSVDHNRALWLGAGLVAVLTLFYLSVWWNRYFGPTLDGYFAFFGHLLLLGKIPYRDFYLHVPPLIPFESAFLEALFGQGLIVPRVIGGLERVAIAVVGYLWLTRLFSLRTAAIATLMMIYVGSGDTVEVLFLYNHHSVLWTLVAGLLASLSLQRRDSVPWLEVLVGASLGLVFLTKQTIGVGVSIALPAALALAGLRREPLAMTLRRLAACAVGWLLPVLTVVLWLARHDALHAAVDQLFLRGPSSKGPVAMILVRAVTGAWQVPSLRLPALLAIVTLIAMALILGRRRSVQTLADEGPRHEKWTALLPMVILAMVSSTVGWLASGQIPLGLGFLHLPQRLAVFLTLYGCFALALYWGVVALRRALKGEEAQLLLFAFVSFASGYMFSTSWPSFEPIAMPGLGLVIGLVLARTPRTPSERFLRVGVWIWISLTFCLCTWLKVRQPFDFAGWVEPPVAMAQQASTLDAMKGFRLAPETVELVETATRLIREHSTAGEPIFVYPHVPVFYLLSERLPPTFAMIHWFDVCDDATAIADAETLLAEPPAVLVDFALREEEYRSHEVMFRDGAVSGQRRLRAALQTLESRYRQVAVLQGGGATVSIWARPDT